MVNLDLLLPLHSFHILTKGVLTFPPGPATVSSDQAKGEEGLKGCEVGESFMPPLANVLALCYQEVGG